jgi:4-amino-4-deoxy-L-arabinose transferase-like glycosyltransferase
VLFALVLLLGIFARVWEFGSLPPGLKQDETSTAVDAFSLYRFGADRNGMSFPVHFISWGSGQNALYGYIVIPFIALAGLNPVAVRLPMLLSGVLSIPLMYRVGNRIAGRSFGLLAMFLLAISPWHILASRWGLEANILPFVFLAAFACLLESTRDNYIFIVAAIFLSVCLYAYGPAYAAVPIFLAIGVAILLITGRLNLRVVLAGLAAFAVLAAPIGFFLLVNTLKLETVKVGLLTIPRLPVQPRIETAAVFFDERVLHTLKSNTLRLASLLWRQGDGLPWNSVDPYGYFYRYTFPLAIIGAGLLVHARRQKPSPERLLVLAWLVAAGSVGVIVPANINRMNLVFIPLLLCVAMCLDWLAQRSRAALVAAVCAFLVGFALFTRDYHGENYRDEAEVAFYGGFLQALDFARHVGDNPICVTNEEVHQPYIYVLFLEKLDPADYLPTIVYADPQAPFRDPTRLGRYRFGLRNCTNHSDGTVYVLENEKPLTVPDSYTVVNFGNYHVFIP